MELVCIPLSDLTAIINTGINAEVAKVVNDLKPILQSKSPEDYIPRQKVAEMLDIDLSTLHIWTVKGKLKSYGIGNRVYYKRSEVELALVPLK